MFPIIIGPWSIGLHWEDYHIFVSRRIAEVVVRHFQFFIMGTLFKRPHIWYESYQVFGFRKVSLHVYCWPVTVFFGWNTTCYGCVEKYGRAANSNG